jgi:ADP-ribosyl-[dinitrogen reductase] hydrolase
MSANRELLAGLFEKNEIDLRRGSLFHSSPSPMPGDLDFERVEGMMLGLAIGDALGNTSESQLPQARHAAYGEIRDYLPNRYADGRRVGLPSDDTQLAFWTLEQMIADGGFDPEHVAARFCRDRIYGIGSAVRQFIANRKAGLPWQRCGVKSAGNGALMRIAPMVIPHLMSGTPDLWVDAALSAMITHNDSASIATCLSFVNMLWQLLAMDKPPEPEWWLDSYVEMARDLEVDDTYRPRGGAFQAYQGTVWRFAHEQVRAAYDKRLPVPEACREWHSGAYLLETVPSVLFILMRHGNDPEEAIVRAVNDTWDNDTIAAIVGAAVGALHGRNAIPERWLSGLLGRTTASDDGYVFELLRQARALWWPQALRSRHRSQLEEGPTPAQIDELLCFLPLFDVPNRDFVESWGGGKTAADGAITMPYPVYPQDVVEFYRLAGQPCWSDYGYEPHQAAQMLADDALIQRATLAEIVTMLTYCVRGERFADGHWAATLESGKIVLLLKRLRALREEAG